MFVEDIFKKQVKFLTSLKRIHIRYRVHCTSFSDMKLLHEICKTINQEFLIHVVCDNSYTITYLYNAILSMQLFFKPSSKPKRTSFVNYYA